MRTWLRSFVDALLGKASQLDSATRMTMDTDFSDRRELSTWPREPIRKADLVTRTEQNCMGGD